ncbi:MAG: hypothetical protein USCGTAYLOR_00299 [Chromatiales bacterium USCg_Taylor]|nr:MAG: hypothetical protein USCGTAYLOR_00299 [Chromatiales bacterium USCg_Taylor]
MQKTFKKLDPRGFLDVDGIQCQGFSTWTEFSVKTVPSSRCSKVWFASTSTARLVRSTRICWPAHKASSIWAAFQLRAPLGLISTRPWIVTIFAAAGAQFCANENGASSQRRHP